MAGLLGLFGCAAAQADTPVNADITANSVWDANGSPYVIDGDLHINNNATLQIESGVSVRFSAGASLTVTVGALSAIGTTAEPIVFTSANDDGSGTPAAGDWGPLTFAAGTRDAATRLDHVELRYGQGIVVDQASPQFNHLRLLNNAGPAMRIDLQSSPTGQGLEAEGNGVDGIVVPAGVIDTDVSWTLQGIPYVLEQGKIRIGHLDAQLSPSEQQLYVDDPGQLELSIADPAPAGGLTFALSSNPPWVVTLPSSVTIAEGQQTATIDLQAASTPYTATVTATATGFDPVSSTVAVVARPVMTLTAADDRLSIPHPLEVTLSISDVAPAGGLSVPLSVSPAGILELPSEVTIPEGSSSVHFTVQGQNYGTATVTAAQTPYVSDTLQLTVERVYIKFEPQSVLMAPGLSRTMTVSITKPAPVGGTTVTLGSANASFVGLPSSVHIAAGENSVDFTANGLAEGIAPISGTAAGYIDAAGNAHVKNVQLWAYEPVLVPLGQTVAAYLRANPYAGTSFTVGIAVLDSTIVTANQASVPFGAYQTTSNTLQLTGLAVGTTELQLASPGLQSQAIAVEVGQLSLHFEKQTVVVGNRLKTSISVRRQLGGHDYSPGTPLTVTLSNSDASKVTVPTSITICGSCTAASISIEGLALTTQPVEIQATAEGYVSPQAQLLVRVVTPTFEFEDLDGSREIGAPVDDFRVRFHVPGAGGASQTTAADLIVNLALADVTPSGIVAGLQEDNEGTPTSQATIAGNSNQSNVVYVASPSASGVYRVVANASGFEDVASDIQHVVLGWLEFAGNYWDSGSVVVGQGLQTEVSLKLAEGELADDPISISLINPAPDVVQVPASVVIPAGENAVSFMVQASGAAPDVVHIAVAADGYGFRHADWSMYPEDGIYVQVVEPELWFDGLDGTREVGAANDDFHLRWTVSLPDQPARPAGVSQQAEVVGEPQTAIVDQAFDIAIKGWPTGIVSGIQDRHGNATSQIRIAAGQNSSFDSFDQQNHQVLPPTATGGYRVEATLSGAETWVSESQVVGAPALVFDPDQIILGVGLQPATVSIMQFFNSRGREEPKPNVTRNAEKAAIQVQVHCESAAVCITPASVTLPDGGYSDSFPLTAVGEGTSYVVLQADGYPGAGQLRVAVREPWLELEEPWEHPFDHWYAGQVNSLWYRLNSPAPNRHGDGYETGYAAQPITASLVSSNPAVVSVPAQITLAEGEYSVDVVFNAVGPGTATITVSGTHLTSTSQTITVKP